MKILFDSNERSKFFLQVIKINHHNNAKNLGTHQLRAPIASYRHWDKACFDTLQNLGIKEVDRINKDRWVAHDQSVKLRER